MTDYDRCPRCGAGTRLITGDVHMVGPDASVLVIPGIDQWRCVNPNCQMPQLDASQARSLLKAMLPPALREMLDLDGVDVQAVRMDPESMRALILAAMTPETDATH